jgi:hypothetical protein
VYINSANAYMDFSSVVRGILGFRLYLTHSATGDRSLAPLISSMSSAASSMPLLLACSYKISLHDVPDDMLMTMDESSGTNKYIGSWRGSDEFTAPIYRQASRFC